MIENIWRTALYYVELALRRPLFLILPPIAVLLIGIVAIINMSRPYYSEGLLIMEFQQIPSSLVSPTVANDRLRFIDQRVMSRNNLAALADRLDLYPGLPVTTTEAWIANRMRSNLVVRTTLPESGEGAPGSASVMIGFKHPKAEKTVQVVSELLQMVIEENRRIRTAKASEATRFLQQEVEEVGKRLERREAEWATFLRDTHDAQPNRLPMMLLELQSREQNLSATDQSQASVEEEIKLLETQLRLASEAARPAGRLRTEMSELNRQIAEGRLMYTNDHPQMRMLRQRADELASVYDAAATDETENNPFSAANTSSDTILIVERLNSAKSRQEGLVAMRAQLKQKIDELKGTIAQASDVEVKLAAINAERQTLQQSLSEMKGRLSVAMMGERLEMGDAAPHVEILEEPILPLSPSGPRRLLLLGALLVASAGAGLAGLVAVDVTDRNIRGTFDLKDDLSGKTLVMIPDWDPEPLKVADILKQWLEKWSPLPWLKRRLTSLS